MNKGVTTSSAPSGHLPLKGKALYRLPRSKDAVGTPFLASVGTGDMGNDLIHPFGAHSPWGKAIYRLPRGKDAVGTPFLASAGTGDMGNDLIRPFGAPSPEGEGYLPAAAE